MRRVNLLREVDNVRNRLRPLPAKRRMRKRDVLAATLMLTLVGWYAVFGTGWEEKPTRMRAMMADEHPPLPPLPAVDPKSLLADGPAPAAPFVDDEPGPMKPASPAAASVTAWPDGPERVEAATAKFVRGERRAAVAEDPAPAPPPAPRWRVRFGLCKHEESCRRLVAELAGRGVKAFLVTDTASMIGWQVTVGPWPTESEAKEAMARLATVGLETEMVRSIGTAWLVARFGDDDERGRRAGAAAKKAGYPVRREKTAATETVYKVYAVREWGEAVAARDACGRWRAERIDCLVERGEGS
jgi:cell division septation protein DedD